jgi:ComF family protein
MTDCLPCRDWPAAVDRARAAYLLGGPAADLVHALKYEGWSELADFMAGRMARALDPVPASAAVVVPVPTTARRMRARGYNQAQLLARSVAELLGLPRSDALARASGRRSQTTLAPSERRRNIRGAFVPTEEAQRVVGRDVVLVDDVLTTGATAGEAASVLSARGAATVTVLAFARAVPDAVARAA